jgi:hypothetical protein
MLEVDAAFNILTGILAFFMIRKGAIPARVSEVEIAEQDAILEADAVLR